ncbi:diguanylate cyclase domain-containing protein [Trichloromonas sp.]|uniref:diguanylate cyclase domain-containing protein n=1 Tax=Trichloromonas sp. TaxID=3069249 RepID=UPI003D819EF6
MTASNKIRLSRLFYQLLILLYLAGSVSVVLLVRANQRQQTLHNAEKLAEVILEKNMAVHTYFAHTLKPQVFELADRLGVPSYFEPGWMSSTYAIRQLNEIFREQVGENYYYKESAIDARSPENEADGLERAFIEELNTDPNLKYRSMIRDLADEPYFVVMRRGEVLDQGCLRCHSTPENAPEGMLALYGSDRSFDRNVGEVISAISIRIPLAQAYADSNHFAFSLSVLLLSILVALFLLHLLLTRGLVFAPLARLRQKAALIAGDPGHLGDRIPLPKGRELAALTEAFNVMSGALRRQQDVLEETVAERTRQLQVANDQLQEDIAERKQAEEKIHQLAYYDSLTGLPNRVLMYDRLEQSLANARRQGCGVVLMFLDLDDFKVVNDTLGHEAGDRYLRTIAERLSGCLRKNDTVARFGGDEFVFCGQIAHPDETPVIASKILGCLKPPITIDGHPFVTTASIGVATYPTDGSDAATLLKLADAAMYEAKGRGKNAYFIHGGDGRDGAT